MELSVTYRFAGGRDGALAHYADVFSAKGWSVSSPGTFEHNGYRCTIRPAAGGYELVLQSLSRGRR